MSSEPERDGNLTNLIEWIEYLAVRDSVTGASTVIDVVHKEIHDGNSYSVTVFDSDVDIAAPKYVRITAPDSATRIHLIVFVSANGGFLYEFYEDPTLLADGSALTEFNCDRNSSNTPDATTFEDTTTQAPNNDGTLLDAGYSGGAQKKVSGESGSRDEWILEANQDYLVKITPDANDTKIVIVLKWYEIS